MPTIVWSWVRIWPTYTCNTALLWTNCPRLIFSCGCIWCCWHNDSYSDLPGASWNAKDVSVWTCLVVAVKEGEEEQGGEDDRRTYTGRRGRSEEPGIRGTNSNPSYIHPPSPLRTVPLRHDSHQKWGLYKKPTYCRNLRKQNMHAHAWPTKTCVPTTHHTKSLGLDLLFSDYVQWRVGLFVCLRGDSSERAYCYASWMSEIYGECL